MLNLRDKFIGGQYRYYYQKLQPILWSCHVGKDIQNYYHHYRIPFIIDDAYIPVSNNMLSFPLHLQTAALNPYYHPLTAVGSTWPLSPTIDVPDCIILAETSTFPAAVSFILVK